MVLPEHITLILNSRISLGSRLQAGVILASQGLKYFFRPPSSGDACSPRNTDEEADLESHSILQLLFLPAMPGKAFWRERKPPIKTIIKILVIKDFSLSNT